MKTCTRCKEVKPITDFQTDARRKGFEGYYQNPCKECRKSVKRVYRSLKQDLQDKSWVKSFLKRRHGFKESELTKELISLYIASMNLKRTLEQENKLIINQNLVVCNRCNGAHLLNLNGDIDKAINILETLKERHKCC